MISLRKHIAIVGVAVATSLTATSVAHAESVSGGGASFPDLFIQPAVAEFNKTTGHSVSYATSGSSTGQKEFSDNKFDFGGTDSAVSSSNQKLRAWNSFNWVYVPYVAGSIAVTYRLDELKGAQLSLSQATVEKIFNGTIAKWNDPAIAKDMKENPTWSNSKKKSDYKGVSSLWQNERRTNSAVVTVAMTPTVVKKAKGKTVEVIDSKSKKVVSKATVAKQSEIKMTVRTNKTSTYQVKLDGKTVAEYKLVKTPKLPDKDIVVVYRDGSGTSANFSTFAKSVNSAWGASNDFSKNVPGGVSGFGSRFQKQESSSNLANYVADTNGSIGYVEKSFTDDAARQSKGIRAAALKNNFGDFAQPSADAYGKFLSGSADMDTKGFVTFNFTKKTRGAYPIGAVTYLLAETESNAKNTVVREFVTWAINTYAPAYANGLGFVPLDGAFKTKALSMAAKVGAG
jgi:phosphate transport system substrate-binding protein